MLTESSWTVSVFNETDFTRRLLNRCAEDVKVKNRNTSGKKKFRIDGMSWGFVVNVKRIRVGSFVTDKEDINEKGREMLLVGDSS